MIIKPLFISNIMMAIFIILLAADVVEARLIGVALPIHVAVMILEWLLPADDR